MATMQNTTLFKVSDKSHNFLTFYDIDKDEEVGCLSWENGVFKFTGDADTSARLFFSVLQNCFETQK